MNLCTSKTHDHCYLCGVELLEQTEHTLCVPCSQAGSFTMAQLMNEAYLNAEDKGFHAPGWVNDSRIGEEAKAMYIAQKLALIHEEVSEALTATRKDAKDDHLPHLDGITAELADVCIRVFDLSQELSLPLISAIVQKMNYNRGREYKHGKNF